MSAEAGTERLGTEPDRSSRGPAPPAGPPLLRGLATRSGPGRRRDTQLQRMAHFVLSFAET